MSEFFDTNIITYALISFLLGALAMLIYYKIKSRFKASYLANIGVIDTIVSQYKQRLDQFEDIINELKINMNLLESKLSNNSGNNAKIINHVIDDPTSQQISQHFEGGNELPESKHVIKGSNDPKISVSNGYFHTSDTLETILESAFKWSSDFEGYTKGDRKNSGTYFTRYEKTLRIEVC